MKPTLNPRKQQIETDATQCLIRKLPMTWARWGLSVVALICFLPGLTKVSAQNLSDAEKQSKTVALKAEMEAAMDKVKAIVNQPVPVVKLTPGTRYGNSPEGWFHEGATKPDFSKVDVRQTQTFPYLKHPLITSPLNPGVAFPGPQLEFNSMTKYFYTNRNLPKKRLTEAEMLEINRLYRVIGKCESELAALNPPAEEEMVEVEGEWTLNPIARENYVKAGIAIVIVLGLYIGYRAIKKN